MRSPKRIAPPAPPTRRSLPPGKPQRAPRSATRRSKRRLADLAAEIREILETEPETLAGLAGFEADTPLPEIAEVEADLDKLKRDRERLGAVNLRAEEELREVETQHSTLVSERDDLVEAIKRLRLGIQSLNREGRERLLTAFAVVNCALPAPVRRPCSAAARRSCS